MTEGSVRRVETVTDAVVRYLPCETIRLKDTGEEFLPLCDVYDRVKKYVRDADAVQRFRNNLRYGKYRVQTVRNGKGESVRSVSVTEPNTTDNTSIRLVFVEDKGGGDEQ